MAEPESFIELSAESLSQRDLSKCRKYALLAKQSDPNESSADKILAVADVIAAGERRLRGSHRDWYSVLQIRRREEAVSSTLRERFKRLLLLVSPCVNQFPFSGEAYELVCDAWSVLSNPERKARYDAEIGEEGLGGTFWTACPYCFYVYEYARVYEECCLRCQNCRRPFHGAAMAPPAAVVDGKDSYFCSHVYFPLGCSGPTQPPPVNEKGNGSQGGDAFVEISDDDPCEEDVKESNHNVEDENGDSNCGMSESKVGVEVMESKGKKRVKTVARNSRKIMGTGRLSNEKKVSPGLINISNGDGEEGGSGNGNGGECDLGELKFLDGEDDIIIGLWHTP